jgi:hypothetical protein
MTEREIILLGFKSQLINEHDEDDSYYYVLDIVNGLTFITPTNEEINNNEWYVEFFNTDPLIRFDSFGKLQGLINTLNSAVVK